MKTYFTRFVIAIIFLCLFLSGMRTEIEAGVVNRIQSKKKSQVNIRKIERTLENLNSLYVENGDIYFGGNNKDITKTRKMSDINNSRNNFICRYDLSDNVLHKKQFPPIKLWRKFRLLYGSCIVLVGEKEILTFDKKNFNLLLRKKIKGGILPGNNLLIKETSSNKSYLFIHKGEVQKKEEIVIMETDHLSVVYSSPNEIIPRISGTMICFGEVLSRHRIKVFDTKEGKIIQDLQITDKSIIASLDKKPEVYFFGNKIFLGCSREYFIIDGENGKLIWKSARSGDDEGFEYRFMDGTVLIRSGNDYDIFNIESRKIVNRFTEKGSLQGKILSNEKLGFYLLFIDSDNLSSTKIIVIDQEGKIAAIFNRNCISEAYMDEGYLYLLYQGKDRLLITKEQLIKTISR